MTLADNLEKFSSETSLISAQKARGSWKFLGIKIPKPFKYKKTVYLDYLKVEKKHRKKCILSRERGGQYVLAIEGGDKKKLEAFIKKTGRLESLSDLGLVMTEHKGFERKRVVTMTFPEEKLGEVIRIFNEQNIQEHKHKAQYDQREQYKNGIRVEEDVQIEASHEDAGAPSDEDVVPKNQRTPSYNQMIGVMPPVSGPGAVKLLWIAKNGKHMKKRFPSTMGNDRDEIKAFIRDTLKMCQAGTYVSIAGSEKTRKEVLKIMDEVKKEKVQSEGDVVEDEISLTKSRRE